MKSTVNTRAEMHAKCIRPPFLRACGVWVNSWAFNGTANSLPTAATLGHLKSLAAPKAGNSGHSLSLSGYYVGELRHKNPSRKIFLICEMGYEGCRRKGNRQHLMLHIAIDFLGLWLDWRGRDDKPVNAFFQSHQGFRV